jgi:CYTH domain-containing protein
MGIEIERKFLVQGESWRNNRVRTLRQGYLNRTPNRNVRVRTDGEHGYLTVKGITQGATRTEFEYVIPLDEATEMLDHLCEHPLIEKRRYFVDYANKRWVIDEFLGANEGLILAEIELADEEELFEHPPWLGQEVTYDTRYFNANLSQMPYQEWRET